jgi:hypothetical protein
METVRIYTNPDKVIAVIQEGDEVAGVFTGKVSKTLDREVADMNSTTQAAHRAYMRALLREYADQEGYNDVTVS